MTETAPSSLERTLARMLLWVFGVCGVLFTVTGIVPLQEFWTRLPHDQFFSSALCVSFLFFLATSPGRLRVLRTLGLQFCLLVPWVLYYSPSEPMAWWQAWKFTVGLSSTLVLWTTALRHPDPESRSRLVDVAISAGLLPLFVLTSSLFLGLTIALFPTTYDGLVLALDGTFGTQLSFNLCLAFGDSWFVTTLLGFVYFELPLAVGGLIVLGRRTPWLPSRQLILPFLALAVAGYIIYALFPVAGPAFAFPDLFPFHAPDPDSVSHLSMLVMPVPRNCMPSLHTGWALLLFWHTRGHARWVQRLGLFWLVGTMLATLVLGFHYFIDLVIAWPFTLGILAATTGRIRANASVQRFWVLGFGLGAAWLIVARYGLPILQLHPLVPWSLSLATLVVVEKARLRFQDLLVGEVSATGGPGESNSPGVTTGMTDEDRTLVRFFLLAFVLSGAAGLVYEVVFSKKLALIFGSTSIAVTLVLATFMGGMALGSWLGGRLAAKIRDHLAAYAACEFGIGLFCLATPLWVHLVEKLYLALAPPFLEDTLSRGLLQLGIGGLFLLPPTVFMGMTLPLLAEVLVRRRQTLGRATGILYGANTAGAAVGAIGAGYVLLPVLGVSNSIFVAFGLNLSAILVALKIRKSLLKEGQPEQPSGDNREVSFAEKSTGPATTRPIPSSPEPPVMLWLGVLCMTALAVGGVASFLLETTYFHILNLVAASSSYSFSLMLAMFLSGLALGAWVARRHVLPRGRGSWLAPLALAWIGVAAVLWLGNRLWQGLPGYFASFAYYPATTTFEARELVRGLVCAVAMMPPAFAIGLAYPLAMEGIGQAWPDRAVRMLGRGAALNTLGNIAGTVMASFLLLPRLGSMETVRLAAFVSLLVGVSFLPFLASRARWVLGASALTVALMWILLPASFDLQQLANGSHIYFSQQSYGRVIDHEEAPDSGLVTVTESWLGNQRVRTLLTNGKFEGDDNPHGEMRAQYGFALFPLLHQPERTSALLIGLGTGTSAGVLARSGFESLTIAELSPAILRFARKYFSEVNANVLDRPNVRVRVTDGRNLVFLSPDRYDLISMELSSIWLPGQAAFYNQEFYRLARRRLLPGGVVQQWLQLHRLSRRDLLSIIATLRSVFPEVWLYFSAPDTIDGGQGVLIACTQQCRPSETSRGRLDAVTEFEPVFARMGGRSQHLLRYLLLDAQEIDAMLEWAAGNGLTAEALISTDDNLRLEFSTPRANVRPYRQSLDDNLRFLGGFRRPSAVDRH